MDNGRRLQPHQNPKHPLYHFFQKLPPIGLTRREDHSNFTLPLISTSEKLLTVTDGITKDIRALQKDLAGTWTALESLREQQKALPTRYESEESLRDTVIPSLQELGDRHVEALETMSGNIVTQIDSTLRQELNRACEDLYKRMTPLPVAPHLPAHVRTSKPFQESNRFSEHPITPEPLRKTPVTTPDFLQITSPYHNHSQSSQLPPGQGDRIVKRPVDEETDVEDDIMHHTPSSPHSSPHPRLFRRPSKLVSDLRLPIQATQSIRRTRRPTIGLSRKQSTANRLHLQKRQKRYLDPGSGEE